MAYEPLHHKYRPQSFGALVGQNAIATTLANALTQRRIAPAYLFCGPRGTGKTSSARILAKSLNCMAQDAPTPNPCGTCETCHSITNGSALDFIEIDAASNTGVDNIRELIERAQFAPVQCRYKVYVIDECHMLSTAAFNALLKTLEEPPSNVVFILATTDPQRVLPTIISRCQRFDYRRIPLEPMIGHLRKIADLEQIAIDDEALRLVAQVSQGGLRDAQSLLDQLSLLEPPVAADAVWDLVGAVPERDLLGLVQAIMADDSTAVLEAARRLMDRGREPLIVLQNLAGFYRDLLIAKTASDRQDLVAITPPTWAEMQTLVAPLDPTVLLLGQQHLRSAEVQVKNTTQPRLWLEVTLLGLLPSALASLAPRQSGGPGSTSVVPAPAPPVPAPIATAPVAPAPITPPPAIPTATLSNGSAPLPIDPPPTAPETPAAGPLPPAATTPAIAADTNLPELWLRVIAVLEPLGTRALMQQQGSLLFYDGVVARIGISSRPLFKMAQGRVENIEAAFHKVVGQTVQVSLEVLPDPKPESPAPSTSQAPGAYLAPPHPATVEPTLAAPAPTPTNPAPITGQPTNESPANSVPGVPAMAPPPPPILAKEDVSTPLPPGPTAAALPPIASDFDRAVKNFAQFFNGQVVDLDDDGVLGGESLKPSKAAANQPSHPDKDVPF
jgi:DNA polymerase III subunit gamma/tau